MAGPLTQKFRSADDCPHIEDHTACPSGYLAWHEWAERMAETHVTRRCRHCGFWTVWVPKT